MHDLIILRGQNILSIKAPDSCCMERIIDSSPAGTERYLNQFWTNVIRSSLNQSLTNLTRRFDQTSFLLPIVVRIILILLNTFVYRLHFELVQDWFSIRSYPYSKRLFVMACSSSIFLDPSTCLKILAPLWSSEIKTAPTYDHLNILPK